MSRKDWSEYERNEVIEKLSNKIQELEAKLEHLLSDNWREPYEP